MIGALRALFILTVYTIGAVIAVNIWKQIFP